MTILVADDHELIGNGIVSYYATHYPETTVHTAKNKSELIYKLNTDSYDLLIQDLRFGKDDARELFSEIRRLQPNLKVIVLSSHTDTFSVKSAMSLGFDGYVSKGGAITDLPKAIEAVLAGETYLSPDIKEKLSMAAINGKAGASIELSARELEVLMGIQNELSTKEIAQQLHLSEKTVEAYRSNLFLKFEVKNVAGLVKKAILNGFVSDTD